MKRLGALLWVLLVPVVSLLVAGCVGGKSVTYHYDDKADPGRVTSVTEQGTFAESENLANHYESINKRAEALVRLHQSIDYDSATSQALGGMLIAGYIDRLGHSQAPRTMADVFDRSLPEYLRLGLEVWDRVEGDDRGKRTGSPDLIVEGDGNNLIFDSELGTGDGSRAHFWLGDYSTIEANSTGHASGLSLDASRPYEYNHDASRETHQTWTDSPVEKDGGLF
ncbi:hypothetical protein [Desulfofustis limnaeus]|uniref:Lipoprotein n=1 Tax=Desulfofustis limnaeus TaxID=2740163 RepID=A0ABM7WCC8_9BACT|nr:hypothetical protein [Desulfofustis limnaeus]BDD88689.1 hypothetical protein DPPLL_30540 [Desulfofustis limnaeus]